MQRRRFIQGLAGTGLAAAGLARAQDYPSRPITLVVPFAAGGPTDELGRSFARTLSDLARQPVIVSNRTGAGGSIGMDVVAKAAPDGYTLGLGHTGTSSINPSLYARLPYDPARDLAPISPLVSYTNVLVVNPALPVRSVADYVAWARGHAAAATIASGGIGATNHLSIEILKSVTGVPFTHVPYKGNAPAMLDLVGGQVSAMFDILITALPQIKAGKVRPIAVTSRERSGYLPDVPTMAEAGYPAYGEAGNDLWFGVFAPARTPAVLLERLNGLTRTAMQDPALLRAVKAMYYEPWTLSSARFADFLRGDREKWSKVVVQSGAKAD